MKNNQYECPRCKEVLISKHNYDMQKCGAVAIDGGENLRIIKLDATAEDLALFSLLEQADRNDVVTREEIMKILNDGLWKNQN